MRVCVHEVSPVIGVLVCLIAHVHVSWCKYLIQWSTHSPTHNTQVPPFVWAVQELMWQISESAFLMAALFAFLRVVLSWVSRGTLKRATIFMPLIVVLCPLSYNLLSIQERRWNQILNSVGPVFRTAIWNMARHIRQLLFGNQTPNS